MFKRSSSPLLGALLCATLLPAPALAAHQKNHKSDVAPTEGACPTPTPPAQ